MILYWPVSSVTTERPFSMRASLLASTLTPGNTAPDVTLTTPAIALCAYVRVGHADMHANVTNTETAVLRIISLPPSPTSNRPLVKTRTSPARAPTSRIRKKTPNERRKVRGDGYDVRRDYAAVRCGNFMGGPYAAVGVESRSQMPSVAVSARARSKDTLL